MDQSCVCLIIYKTVFHVLAGVHVLASVCVFCLCESTYVSAAYYPSIKWISFLMHFRMVFQHPATFN